MGNILEDERLQNIKQEEKEALEELENLYGGQISSSKELYAAVKDAAAALGKEQAQQLKEQTQLAVEQLQLQKEEAKQDYLQEQSAAYTDFRQRNQLHGVHEEALADGGLRNTGYAETSRVAMYNQYQNRVAAARAGYTAAMTNYDLGIRQAQAQNNALLAQIALDTLQLQLKYALEAFRFESDLQLEKYKQKGQLQEDFLDKYAQQLQLVQREQAGKGSGGPAQEEQPQEEQPQEEQPARDPKQARGPVPDKAFVGLEIKGKGWKIACIFASVYMALNLSTTASALLRWGERLDMEPPSNKWEVYLDKFYDDERMRENYPTMYFFED